MKPGPKVPDLLSRWKSQDRGVVLSDPSWRPTQTNMCPLCFDKIKTRQNISCAKHPVKLAEYYMWLEIVLRDGNVRDEIDEFITTETAAFMANLFPRGHGSDFDSNHSETITRNVRCVNCPNYALLESCLCKECDRTVHITEYKLRKWCVEDMLRSHEERAIDGINQAPPYRRTRASPSLRDRLRHGFRNRATAPPEEMREENQEQKPVIVDKKGGFSYLREARLSSDRRSAGREFGGPAEPGGPPYPGYEPPASRNSTQRGDDAKHAMTSPESSASSRSSDGLPSGHTRSSRLAVERRYGPQE